jgi:hypothetical protein
MRPLPNETPQEFAKRVQKEMAYRLDVPITDFTRDTSHING